MASKIRRARSEDLQAIQAIERASAQRFLGVMDALAHDEPSPLELLAVRQDAGGLLVAEAFAGERPTLTGFVMFRLLEQSFYIEQIDVAPAFERQRIGATLIDAVAHRARDAGLVRLTLSTFREIPWNAPYYRRLGFVDLDDKTLDPVLAQVRREHLARGLDESARVFMARDL
jgi:ribosomal protein S18 acetylase RimI-like enzyme